MSLKFTRLTRPAIRQLQPGQKITEHGITAECMPTGDTRYSVNVMVDGERIHRVIGRFSEGVTRTQAEEFIAKARSDAKEGRLSLPKGRKTPLTFGEAVDTYLNEQEATGGKNLASKKAHIELHLKPYFGSMRLERITTFTIGKFRKSRHDAGLSVATINRILATYRHMANQRDKSGRPRWPLPPVKLEAEHNERDYVLTPKEEKALLDAALEDPNTYVWLFIKVGLGSSMRHREILSLRFDRLDYDRRRLRVRVKGGRWRDQPVTKELAEILKHEREMAEDRDGWVFPSRRSPEGHIGNMARAFERTVKRAGVDPKRVTPHTVRHTAITRFANTEPRPTIKMLQQFSGHRSLASLYRYMHASAAEVNDALDNMEAAHAADRSKVVPLTRTQSEKT